MPEQHDGPSFPTDRSAIGSAVQTSGTDPAAPELHKLLRAALELADEVGDHLLGALIATASHHAETSTPNAVTT